MEECGNNLRQSVLALILIPNVISDVLGFHQATTTISDALGFHQATTTITTTTAATSSTYYCD